MAENSFGTDYLVTTDVLITNVLYEDFKNISFTNRDLIITSITSTYKTISTDFIYEDLVDGTVKITGVS